MSVRKSAGGSIIGAVMVFIKYMYIFIWYYFFC